MLDTKKYKLVVGRQPVVGDLVYVPSQQDVFKVIHVEAMKVKIETGNGLYMVLPFSHYKLIEPK